MGRAVVGVFVVLALVVSACAGDDTATAPDDTAPGAPDDTARGTDADDTAPPTSAPADLSGYEPQLEEVACDDAVPDEPRMECFELTVPLDRDDPDGEQVLLPVGILRSDAAEPLDDPVVYFSGGPGGAGRGFANTALRTELAAGRDIVVFDQRGTGAAEPSLDCPEMDEAVRANLGAADSREVESERAAAGLLACRDRLEDEGIDLDAFSTPVTADDAEDLRRALDIETWNLFGISYGTTVAIEVGRRHPDAVRSVVLDSVYPPDVEPTGPRLVAAVDRAVATLVAGCGADPTCADAHGDVEARLADLVEDWEDEPFEATVPDPDGGTLDVVIVGSDLIAGLWNAMYDDALIPVLPSLLDVLEPRDEGTEAIVAELVADGLRQLTRPADGVRIAVDCADRGRLQDAAESEQAFAERPELASFAGLTGREGICERWGVAEVDPAFNHLAPWDHPTLVLGDEYDPVTPPEESERTAETLGPTATFVLTERFGHGVVTSHECMVTIFDQFVDDPEGTLDTSCVDDELGPPEFLGG